jgi:hypothetical protein
MSFRENEVNDLKKILKSLESNLSQFRMVLKLIGTYGNGDFGDERFNELKEICKVVLNNVPFMLTL